SRRAGAPARPAASVYGRAAHGAPRDAAYEPEPDSFRTQLPITEDTGMNVRPLRDRILVERIEEAEQKVGGLYIPDTAKEKPQQGKVIAVGKGRVNDKGEVFPLDVKVGDTVLFGKYAGTEIKIDGKEYL